MARIPYYLCENGHHFPIPIPGPEKLGDHKCPTCGTTSESHRIHNGGPGRVFFVHMYEDHDLLCDTCQNLRKPWDIARTELYPAKEPARTCRFCVAPQPEA